jgi:hypothetical protein
MPFANFTNPFQNPTDVPEKYHYPHKLICSGILPGELGRCVCSSAECGFGLLCLA